MNKIDKLLVWIYRALYKYFGTRRLYRYLYVEGYPEGAPMSEDGWYAKTGYVKSFNTIETRLGKYSAMSISEIYNKTFTETTASFLEDISMTLSRKPYE